MPRSRAEAEDAAIARGWASREDEPQAPQRGGLVARPPLFQYPWLRIEIDVEG